MSWFSFEDGNCEKYYCSCCRSEISYSANYQFNCLCEDCFYNRLYSK